MHTKTSLDSMLAEILSSEDPDWIVTGEQPYLASIWTNSRRDAASRPIKETEVDRPHSLMVLRSNLSIALAIGLKDGDSFNEPWAQNFPDGSARPFWVDFMFNGCLIFRERLVSVDGGRCSLPVPLSQTPPYQVPARLVKLARLVQGSAENTYSFDEYFSRAGLEECDAPWPKV